MRLKHSASTVTGNTLEAAESMVAGARTVEQLKDLCYALWPRLRIEEGPNHLRLTPSGESNGQSFYVEITPMPAPNEPSFDGINLHLEEPDRQMTILALAHLSVERPGWEWTLGRLAELLGGREMFNEFRKYTGPPPGYPKDSSNEFGVAVAAGERLIVTEWKPDAFDLVNPVFAKPRALRLAVWLALLSDPELVEFHRLVGEIKKPS